MSNSQENTTGHPASAATGEVRLRDVTDDDLPTFFDQQLDPDANHMAAFTSKDPSDEDAFTAHWKRIRGDDTITLKSVLVGEAVAGYIASFERSGDREVSYWFGRAYWGTGVATGALRQFLANVSARPLYARVAKDNAASIRVLEKCGFAVSGDDKGFANARGAKVEEFILKLPVRD